MRICPGLRDAGGVRWVLFWYTILGGVVSFLKSSDNSSWRRVSLENCPL